MNHLDLFSGIGGFSLAIKNEGIEHNWHGYSDIDKYANNIFRRHFNEAKQLGGIESVQPEDLPRLDLITFGFPCQDLSVANIRNRKGLKGKRSSLFFEAMRIIRDKKPKYFIAENVRGVFSSNGGKDFEIILKEFIDAGYDCQWELLNSMHEGGVPQSRFRCYFVGHRRGEPRPPVFPLGRYGKKTEKQNKEIKIADWRSDEGLRIRKNNMSPTLTTSTPIYIVGDKIRRITPVEAARLQGFPDDWNDCCSDNQRYKQYGNAITVNLAESIFRKLYKCD